MYILSNENRTPVITYKTTAQFSYISTFVHVFRNEMCMKIRECLYYEEKWNPYSPAGGGGNKHCVDLSLCNFCRCCSSVIWLIQSMAALSENNIS